ncbi:hypothetical protein ThidrDRAFT_2488 [Thiorhodococcus drewsii AZ1]|uniref:DUF4224 domain-containing protein n=1 Tax=Thiorhodococcus drewsii AZ1 TaxID=765913 RepID=G2E2E0_9GAMM|nr:DUF4224 domain-containing protein [Thiorhodococcus drewsii]EGV30856.1 hypothetical protein ThidrDRAFT_2488 [Thiorhodococcus drewsii AZ1]
MKHPATLTQEDLEDLTGLKQVAAIEAWCQRNGVRYLRVKKGLCTTVSAVEAAMGLHPEADTPQRQRLDF